jgi:hypothetical protein
MVKSTSCAQLRDESEMNYSESCAAGKTIREILIAWQQSEMQKCLDSPGVDHNVPSMKTPVSVRALPGFRIHLKYDDGTEGDIDLSDLAGKGPFEAWSDSAIFQRVEIGSHREIRWNDEIELCPDAMYMRLTGMTPEQYFAKAPLEPAHA